MVFSARHRADLALLGVAFLWGITFPLIRGALESLSPHNFVAWRFSLATVAFLPLVLARPGSRAALGRALWPGLWLGALAWSSYFTQTIGLQTVEAGRAAFITGTSVIMVPFLSPVFRAGRPTRVDVAAAGLATFGLFLLTGPTGGGGFTVGDAWILLCALTYTIYIHALQKVLRNAHGPMALAFTQVLGIGVAAWIAFPFAHEPLVVPGGQALVAILICALLATVGTFWLQTRFQGRTTPERVALLFSMEPVFATMFAYLLLGEVLAPLGFVGGFLILVAVVGVELLGAKRPAGSD